jgi:hypothetical protein
MMKKLGFAFALITSITFSAIATASTYGEGLNAPISAEYLLVELAGGFEGHVTHDDLTVDHKVFIYSHENERLIQAAVELVINNSEKEFSFGELSAEEILLMNGTKDIASQVGDLIEMLEANSDLDQRVVALAKTNLQQGFM